MPSTIELNQADGVSGNISDEALCVGAEELLNERSGELANDVRSACLDAGFFFVDVSEGQRKTLEFALDQMQRFFALDDSDARKNRVRQSETNDFGWVPKYTEPAYQPGTVSSLEAYDFGRETVDAADDEVWPELHGFCNDLSACWREFSAIGEAALAVVSEAAGMQADFLPDNCNSQTLNTMRLLSYAPEDSIEASRDVGIAAHTDFECITLLYQTTPGLELRDVEGNWLDASVAAGRIVVLLDDMLERWTNGEFKATGHRVRRTTEHRYSIVFFVAVNDDLQISPLSQFTSESRPAKFAPIGQRQHIANEIERARQNAAAGVTPEVRDLS